MSEINLRLRNNIATSLKAAALEGKALSDHAHSAISHYLIHLEKDRFFVDCTAAGMSAEEAEQAWQATRKNANAWENSALDSSIAKGLAAGVFSAAR